ncbi:hypothetical protein SEVIR_5G417650v4 [Setaria viridis]
MAAATARGARAATATREWGSALSVGRPSHQKGGAQPRARHLPASVTAAGRGPGGVAAWCSCDWERPGRVRGAVLARAVGRWPWPTPVDGHGSTSTTPTSPRSPRRHPSW